jgi:hypothetical protein
MIPGLPMIYRVRISGVGAEESAFPPGPLRFWCSLMGDLECLLISSYGFCDTIVFCVWNWVTLLVCFRGPRATQEQMKPHDLPHLSPHPDLLSWERPWPPTWCVSQKSQALSLLLALSLSLLFFLQYQGFKLAYTLSHSTSPFCVRYFRGRVSWTLWLGWL